MQTTSEAHDFGVILKQTQGLAAKQVRAGRMIGGLHDADDIAQMAAIRQWEGVEKSVAAVRFSMLKAFAYGSYQLRTAEAESGQSSEYAASVEGDLESVELEDLLATLPQDRADMLRLRYMEGYTFEEIGDLFGLERRLVAKMVRESLEELRAKANG